MGIDLDDVTYYVGAETIVPAEDGKGLPRWQEALFAAMGRNAARISDYLATALRPGRRDRARDRDLIGIDVWFLLKRDSRHLLGRNVLLELTSV